jgi:adenine-specific DNA-methyltransferase
MCFIVPRSFASGFYFRRFRRRLHSVVRLDRVHLFESRRDAFKGDGVLQENVIALYSRAKREGPTVSISVSEGEHDLSDAWVQRVERTRVMGRDDRHSILFLPTSQDDLHVMDIFDGWSDTLASHGLGVSTGPVVPFRSTEHVAREPGGNTVPMLWLQHVRPGAVTWPLGDAFRKTEHIRADAPPKLLVRNSTYVLMRRFSAKEEARRLVAAPLLAGQLPGEVLGFENHLNFIHRPRGTMTRDEASWLTTLLNSQLFDSYFRISNGNTQVSATELRALPLPSPSALGAFAKSLKVREEMKSHDRGQEANA